MYAHDRRGPGLRSVIVIDDNLTTLDSFGSILDWGSLGFDLVGCFDQSSVGLEHLIKDQPDIAFCDVVMPSPTGLEVLEAAWQENCRTRVVMISAYHEFDYVQTAMRQGAYDYVLKPLVSDRIVSLLARVEEDIKREEDVQRRLEEHLPLKQERILRNAIYGQTEPASVLSGALFPARFLEGPVKRSIVARALATTNATSGSPADPRLYTELQDAIGSLIEAETARVISLDETAIAVVFSGSCLDVDRGCDRITSGIAKIDRDLRRRFRVGLCLGLGTRVGAFDELRVSFSGALTAVERAAYLGAGTIVDAETDLPDSGNGGQAIDVAQETEDDLIRLLRVRAMSAFDRAFEKLLCALRDERVPRETAYAVMLNVYARIRRLLDSASADDKESTGRLARTLWRTRRQEDTIRVFGDAVMLIVDQVRRDSSCSDERVADRAREVVREQFTDPSLSVAMIAESLGLSPNYLSSLYKKATDTNMTDYIAEVRLNAAADALSNSDALVYEIAERVGYSSPYHFSTRFKRRFGLAPLQYRKLHSFR